MSNFMPDVIGYTSNVEIRFYNEFEVVKIDFGMIITLPKGFDAWTLDEIHAE